MSEGPHPDLLEILLLLEDMSPHLPSRATERSSHADAVVSNVQAMFPGHETTVSEMAERLGLWDGPSWLG